MGRAKKKDKQKNTQKNKRGGLLVGALGFLLKIPLFTIRHLPRMLVLFFVGSLVVVAVYRFVGPPTTLSMVFDGWRGFGVERQWVPLDKISPNLVDAVIAAEDSKFCAHWGFDIEALRSAFENNKNGGKVRGGSTISQQAAKNVFLWQHRSWVRKGLEAYFTSLLELFWSKRRIMEVYLNVAEFGPGVFGAEAAAREIFGKPALKLTRWEAAKLAAVLPSPKRWSVKEPGPYVRSRTATLYSRAEKVRHQGLSRCVKP